MEETALIDIGLVAESHVGGFEITMNEADLGMSHFDLFPVTFLRRGSASSRRAR